MVDPIRALLAEMADALDHDRQCLMDDRRLTHPLAYRARAVLAAAQGEAEADGPAVQGREPASVAEQPNDEDWDALVQNVWDGQQTIGYQGERFMYEGDFEIAAAMLRDELARWGHPAQPAPPAEGEVAELVAWLRLTGNGQPRLSDEGFARLTRAAELLAQAHPTPPAPVPVSAGHPPNADCDRGGRCWWFDPHNGGAWYYDTFQWPYSHWLPAGAIPRPGLTTEAPE